VRSRAGASAPSSDQVRSAWEDNVIRLTLEARDGATFRTGVFVREGGGTGPDTLSRAAQTVLDARGTFRAELRDAGDTPVGWLRARNNPYQAATRIYDAALPPAIDDSLAVAAFLVLDAELTWIEDHALDVYRGQGGGPVERSSPR
jgi:hypothetical protein